MSLIRPSSRILHPQRHFYILTKLLLRVIRSALYNRLYHIFTKKKDPINKVSIYIRKKNQYALCRHLSDFNLSKLI